MKVLPGNNGDIYELGFNNFEAFLYKLLDDSLNRVEFADALNYIVFNFYVLKSLPS